MYRSVDDHDGEGQRRGWEECKACGDGGHETTHACHPSVCLSVSLSPDRSSGVVSYSTVASSRAEACGAVRGGFGCIGVEGGGSSLLPRGANSKAFYGHLNILIERGEICKTCHYQKWVSPLCHQFEGLRHSASIKQAHHAIMPFCHLIKRKKSKYNQQTPTYGGALLVSTMYDTVTKDKRMVVHAGACRSGWRGLDVCFPAGTLDADEGCSGMQRTQVVEEQCKDRIGRR